MTKIELFDHPSQILRRLTINMKCYIPSQFFSILKSWYFKGQSTKKQSVVKSGGVHSNSPSPFAKIRKWNRNFSSQTNMNIDTHLSRQVVLKFAQSTLVFSQSATTVLIRFCRLLRMCVELWTIDCSSSGNHEWRCKTNSNNRSSDGYGKGENETQW